MYARTGARPPAIEAFFQNATPVAVVSCSGTPTRPIAPPGRAIASAVFDGLLEAHAFEYRVRSVLRQLPDALDPILAALAHDIGSPELLPERRPRGVAAEQDDPVGAEALRCDHTAEPDSAVADHGNGLAGSDLRRHGRVGPVPITSVSVSRDGIKASSASTGSTTSVPSACGTRTASP